MGTGGTLEWGTLVSAKATKFPSKDPQGRGGDPAPTPTRDMRQGLCRAPQNQGVAFCYQLWGSIPKQLQHRHISEAPSQGLETLQPPQPRALRALSSSLPIPKASQLGKR